MRCEIPHRCVRRKYRIRRHSPFRLRNCWEGRSVRASSLLRQNSSSVPLSLGRTRPCKTTASPVCWKALSISTFIFKFYISPFNIKPKTDIVIALIIIRRIQVVFMLIFSNCLLIVAMSFSLIVVRVSKLRISHIISFCSAFKLSIFP